MGVMWLLGSWQLAVGIDINFVVGIVAHPNCQLGR